MNSSLSYTHEQSTPAETWEVEHNLNTLAPICDVFIVVGGATQKIIPLQVTVIDANNVEIEFSEARSGTARLI